MDVKQVQSQLVAAGWPIAVDGHYGPRTTEAAHDFQRGWTGWDLVIDGIVGPETERALSSLNVAHVSEHFRFVEFADHVTGWIKVNRVLVRALEAFRHAFYPGGLTVVSGYRSGDTNGQVGGVPGSQHLYGNAADVAPVAHVAEVVNLHLFSGIGHNMDGRVRHVDVRHDGPNTTGGTTANPTLWTY